MSLRARLLDGIDKDTNSTAAGRQFIENVKAVLDELDLSKRASEDSGVFDLLKEIKGLLATNPAIKDALVDDVDDHWQYQSSWNAIIRRFFQATPTLYPVVMDAIRYWNRLEELDVGRCLHQTYSTFPVEEVCYEKTSSGTYFRTFPSHIPHIQLPGIVDYTDASSDKDFDLLQPFLTELVHYDQRPISVGPVTIGHDGDGASFVGIMVTGMSANGLRFCLRKDHPNTTHPLIFVSGRVTDLSSDSTPTMNNLSANRERLPVEAIVNGEECNTTRVAEISSIKISPAENLQADIDIGRSISRFEYTGKGTIGGIVRVGSGEPLILSANHVLCSQSDDPAPIGGTIMVPANMELLRLGQKIGYISRSVSEEEKDSKAKAILALYESAPHGSVRFGRLGRDDQKNREDWSLCSLNEFSPLVLRDDSRWSAESVELLEKAFHPATFTTKGRPMPIVTTTGRRVSSFGEAVIKLGAQGGGRMGKVGSKQWRTYYKNSWMPFNPPEHDSDDDKSGGDGSMELEEEEGTAVEGASIEEVEWSNFTAVSSLERGRPLAEPGDSGCGVYGASIAVNDALRYTSADSTNILLESIVTGDGIAYLGELVTVSNGRLGAVGLMVGQKALFEQMEKETGETVVLIR